MKLLITGSDGYIGKALVQRATDMGHTVLGLDWPMDCTNPQDLDYRLRLLREMDNAEEEVGAVLHLAAVSSVPEAEAGPGNALNTNVMGTVRVLEAASRHRVRRFILASTGAVSPHPSSVYSWSKLMAEKAVRRFRDIPARTILRLFNVAGGEHKSATHLFPNVARALVQDEVLDITAPSSTIRDFIHVEDVALAFLHFAYQGADNFSLDSPTSTLDIGAGVGVSLEAVLRKFQRSSGKQLRTRTTGDRPGDSPHPLIADPAKARNRGWWAIRSLDEMVEDALSFARKEADYE